jgi:hypothetical protein
VCAAGAAGVFAVLLAVRRLERRLAALDRLQACESALQKLGERDQGLDLRRVEHVLIDVRDGLKRLEDRLLAVAEARPGSGGGGTAALLPAAGASALLDRVLQRLLALGYERIHVVTPATELARLHDAEGWVVVEARRDGVACKGRVHVARGLVGELEIQPAYSAFP